RSLHAHKHFVQDGRPPGRPAAPCRVDRPLRNGGRAAPESQLGRAPPDVALRERWPRADEACVLAAPRSVDTRPRESDREETAACRWLAPRRPVEREAPEAPPSRSPATSQRRRKGTSCRGLVRGPTPLQ